MTQKALCVGAGPEQTPSIIEAQQLGLQVVAVGVNPAAPGLPLADHGLVIDIADEEAVINAAWQHNVSLVLPAPIGRYLTTVGAVNDALGLRGISRQAAVNCTALCFLHLPPGVVRAVPDPEQVQHCTAKSCLITNAGKKV